MHSTTLNAPIPRREDFGQWLTLLPLRSFFSLSARLAPALAAPLARRLFCMPRGLRQIAADYSKVPPYEEITLAHRGHQIRTYGWHLDTGRPRVLLAHGWAGHGLQFASLVGPLSLRASSRNAGASFACNTWNSSDSSAASIAPRRTRLRKTPTWPISMCTAPTPESRSAPDTRR